MNRVSTPKNGLDTRFTNKISGSRFTKLSSFTRSLPSSLEWNTSFFFFCKKIEKGEKREKGGKGEEEGKGGEERKGGGEGKEEGGERKTD